MFRETKMGHDESSVTFRSDPLLPVQFYDHSQRPLEQDPNRKLMLAVLDNALECLQKHLLSRSRRGKRLYREAEEWIKDETGAWMFSFENVCQCLDLDPGYMRKHLRIRKEKELARLQGSQGHATQATQKKGCKKAMRAAA
jgi:hypothetical protein